MADILVIEDDAELQGVLVALLGSEGHRVEAVSSGEAALVAAAEANFDLVIADVRMEGMSGLDAIERVKENDSEMKSLVITGYASEEDSIRAVSLGVEAYLKKPFSLDDFLEAVNQAVRDLANERSAQRQRRELAASFEWSLNVMARMVEQSPEAPNLSRLGPTVEEFCKKLDVVESLRSNALVTALYLGLREPLAAFSENSPPFPKGMTRALEAVDESFDGSGEPKGLKGEELPLETRIAQVAYSAITEAEGKEEPGAFLAQEYPGRFDPELLTLLDKKEQADQRLDTSTQTQRNLLSLGRAFEASGNLGSARQAYQNVMSYRNNRFSLEASLGLTRLAANDGKEPARVIQAYSQRALGVAEHVGAAPFGWCALELSLILNQVGLKQKALAALEKSERAFSSLKLSVGSAAVKLGAFALEREVGDSEVCDALQAVLNSSFGDKAESLVVRLLPKLLGAEGEDFESISTRLCREYPEQVLQKLNEKLFSSLARTRIAKAQTRYVLPFREVVLERLAADSDDGVRELAEVAQQGTADSVAVPSLKVFSLGPLSVFRGGKRVQETQWRSQKAKYLLAMLAAAGDKPVSEDKILDCFWPGSQKKGRNCLYWTTSALRGALGVEGFDMDPVVRTPSGLQINPDIPLWHDLQQFEELSKLVRRGSTSAYNIEEYLHVLDLYQGPYLEGAYFDWVISERHRLEVQATELLTRFVDWTESTKRFHNTLEYAMRLTEIDPSSEVAHIAVMKAFLGLGKPKEALGHFERAKTILREEYEADPSIQLLEYEQRAHLALDSQEMTDRF